MMMLSWPVFCGMHIFFIMNQASGEIMYRIQSSKAIYENFSDKMLLNVSVSKLKGLTVYINILEELNELITDVSLVVDLYDKNDFDFDVVRRTINTCRLFKEPTYEPVIQYLYKLFLSKGNFPTDCPIQKGLYYIKDLKADPKNLPQMMVDKKAILKIKHLTKENQKMKLLAYYEVHFGVERADETIETNRPKRPQTKPRKPNRHRTLE